MTRGIELSAYTVPALRKALNDQSGLLDKTISHMVACSSAGDIQEVIDARHKIEEALDMIEVITHWIGVKTWEEE